MIVMKHKVGFKGTSHWFKRNA